MSDKDNRPADCAGRAVTETSSGQNFNTDRRGLQDERDDQ